MTKSEAKHRLHTCCSWRAMTPRTVSQGARSLWSTGCSCPTGLESAFQNMLRSTCIPRNHLTLLNQPRRNALPALPKEQCNKNDLLSCPRGILSRPALKAIRIAPRASVELAASCEESCLTFCLVMIRFWLGLTCTGLLHTWCLSCRTP